MLTVSAGDSRPASRLSSKRSGCMPVNWEKDVDAGLRKAQESGRAVLLDFSAAPT
jgi:hypothetical protein